MLKFSCEKALLQAAAATASRAVAAKSSIPALEGLLLEGSHELTLSGYNTQTGIRTSFEAQIREEGRIVLNAKLFGDIIRKMPDDVIVFSADEKYMVHLSCGDASFDILGLSADNYPELPEVDDQYSVTMQQKTLKAMIGQTAFAVSTNESRPVHTGSLFEIDATGLTMVSVDGFRLALRHEPLEKLDGGAFRFVAPGSALKEVESICGDTEDSITITQGKRHLMFAAGSTELICRRLEGEFLDYKNAIPRNNPVCIDVEIPPTACNAAAYKFAVILICTNLTQIISIVNCFYFQKNDCLQETAIFYNQSYYRRKPSRIFCSASSAVSPRVMSLRICSPAILPMAAS